MPSELTNSPITDPERRGKEFQSLKEVLTSLRLSVVTLVVVEKLFCSTPSNHQAKV